METTSKLSEKIFYFLAKTGSAISLYLISFIGMMVTLVGFMPNPAGIVFLIVVLPKWHKVNTSFKDRLIQVGIGRFFIVVAYILAFIIFAISFLAPFIVLDEFRKNVALSSIGFTLIFDVFYITFHVLKFLYKKVAG